METVIEEPAPAPARVGRKRVQRGAAFQKRLGLALLRSFTCVATTVWRFSGDWRGLRPLLSRAIAHVAILTIAATVLLVGATHWPAIASRPLPSAPEILAQQTTPDAAQDALAQVIARNGQLSPTPANGPVIRRAAPHTIIPERPRLGIITYTVQAGDTVENIARSYGLDPTTIAWSNSAVEDAPDLLRVGQVLVILPINGVYHTVVEGDTLESIAEKYKAEVGDIVGCAYNPLQGVDTPLVPGMQLIVPGGEKPYVPRVVTSYAGPVPTGAQGSGRFQWPVLGQISQGYWYAHRAIDVAAPTGTAVRAADGGFVSFAGWTDLGYGYLIVIDHANGFSTYYAHLSNLYVASGQAVERGQVIGAVGSTGRSTGPHLHFEIRYHGVAQNPRAYLP